MSRRLCVQQGGAGWLLLLALLPMFVLSACRSQETELPAETTEKTEVALPGKSQEIDLLFETIEQKLKADLGPPYKGRELAVMIITRPEEIAQLNDWVTEDAKSRLQTLDYDTYFALIVFQGWKPTFGYSIQIERIIRQEEKVLILARLEEPEPDEVVPDTVTSPYHLIQVQKEDTLTQDVVFDVVADGIVVISVSYTIP